MQEHQRQPLLEMALGQPCPYCGVAMNNEQIADTPTRDHCLPKSKGADLNGANRVIVCRTCNGDKANLTLRQFLEALIRRGDESRASYVAEFMAGMYADHGHDVGDRLVGRYSPMPVAAAACIFPKCGGCGGFCKRHGLGHAPAAS